MWIKTNKLTPKIVGKTPMFDVDPYMFDLSNVISIAKHTWCNKLVYTIITFKNGDKESIDMPFTILEEKLNKNEIK